MEKPLNSKYRLKKMKFRKSAMDSEASYTFAVNLNATL